MPCPGRHKTCAKVEQQQQQHSVPGVGRRQRFQTAPPQQGEGQAPSAGAASTAQRQRLAQQVREQEAQSRTEGDKGLAHGGAQRAGRLPGGNASRGGQLEGRPRMLWRGWFGTPLLG